MVGIIVFLAVVVFIIYAVIYTAINDKKQQEESAQKEAQKKALEEYEKQKVEQHTEREIQIAISRIERSDFYKELVATLKECIKKDIKTYLTNAYMEYMKTPGATSSQFDSVSTIKEKLPSILGDIDITLSGIHYAHYTQDWSIAGFYPYNKLCDIQVIFSKNGYSNMTPLQVWALAQKMSDDLGYRVELIYLPYSSDTYDMPCKHIAMDAVRCRYLEMAQKDSKTILRINANFMMGYLEQYIASETHLLQNSNISYKSAF